MFYPLLVIGCALLFAGVILAWRVAGWMHGRWKVPQILGFGGLILGGPSLVALVLFAIPFLGKFFVPGNVADLHEYLVANRAWVDHLEMLKLNLRSESGPARGWLDLRDEGMSVRVLETSYGKTDTVLREIQPRYRFQVEGGLRLVASTFVPEFDKRWVLSASDSLLLADPARRGLWRERTRILLDSFHVRDVRTWRDDSILILRAGSDLLVRGTGLPADLHYLDGCTESIFHHQIQLEYGWTVIRNVDCKE